MVTRVSCLLEFNLHCLEEHAVGEYVGLQLKKLIEKNCFFFTLKLQGIRIFAYDEDEEILDY